MSTTRYGQVLRLDGVAHILKPFETVGAAGRQWWLGCEGCEASYGPYRTEDAAKRRSVTHRNPA